MTITGTDTSHESVALIDQVVPAAVPCTPELPRRRSTGRRSIGWRIADGTGAVVAEGLSSRSQAIRLLGTYAKSHSLPLTVLDEVGRPTGDRLG